MKEKSIAVHGHRGARAVRPENTLAAFSYALEVGVDVLELDLAITQDDRVVVSHDLVASTTLCSIEGAPVPEGWVFRAHTLEEVKRIDCGTQAHARFPGQVRTPEKIPTLDEVFELVKARGDERVQFNIETKIKPAHPDWSPDPARYAALVVEVFEQHGMTSRTYLQSFDHRTLRAARQIMPALRRVQLISDNLVDVAELAKREDAHISPDKDWLTRDQVEAVHALGKEVIPWTANDEASWAHLVDLGVDAIITDDPKALIDWLKARGLR